MASKEIINRYPAVAVSGVCETTKDGKPYVNVEMRGLENEAGKRFYVKLFLTEKAQEISAKTLRTLGWSCMDITKLEGLGSVTVDICESLRTDTQTGKQYPQYDIWPKRPARPTMRDEDRASFAAKFKALAASTPTVAVDANNAAPATLPEPRATNGKGGTSAAASTDGAADPSSLYA